MQRYVLWNVLWLLYRHLNNKLIVGGGTTGGAILRPFFRKKNPIMDSRVRPVENRALSHTYRKLLSLTCHVISVSRCHAAPSITTSRRRHHELFFRESWLKYPVLSLESPLSPPSAACAIYATPVRRRPALDGNCGAAWQLRRSSDKCPAGWRGRMGSKGLPNQPLTEPCAQWWQTWNRTSTYLRWPIL